MLVSVILPCYNSEKLISDSIQSIFNQTFQKWELIIIDDASTDNTVEIIRQFTDPRIRLIQLPVNQGYPHAMNIGIGQASGKYIARMDADDVSHPRRLEEQLRVLKSYPQASFCGVARYRITPGGKMYVDRKEPAVYYQEETWNDLLNGSRIFTDPSVMAEKEKILAVGGYRTFQRSGMDVDLWFRLMEKYGPCITITAPLFGKRLEPGSLVFKPETALINQVPRVLARQRKEQGTDAVQRGEPIDLQAWLNAGLLKPVTARDQLALSIGACVTCLTLGDWHGSSVYFASAARMNGGILNRLRLLWQVMKKFMERLRNNPYKPYQLRQDVV
jgi:hypothetical protein